MSQRLTALTIAAIVTLTAGCGLGGGEQSQASKSIDTSGEISGEVSFQTWSLKTGFKDYFESLIKDFETKHPKVKINWVDQPADHYADKITSQITTKTLPDVINLPPEIAYSAAKAGALLDLRPSVSDLDDKYQKTALDAYSYSGVKGTYAFPWYLGTNVCFWNKELMSKGGLDPKKAPPKTLDELIEQAKILHDKTDGSVTLMSRKPEIMDFSFAGVKIMDDEQKKFVFNTPESVAILDKYVAAYKAGYMPKNILSSEYLGNSELFKKEQVAWTTAGGSFIAKVKESDPTLADKMVPSPNIGAAPLWAQGISVNAAAKNSAAALTFAAFVTNEENQVNFTTKTTAKGFFPGSKGKQSTDIFNSSDGTPAQDGPLMAWKALPEARIAAPPLWTDAMRMYLDQQIADALTEKISSKQALDNAVQKANSLLNY
ncbi:hypothetical protein KEM60_01032 [Austwickia sp. TVS 96-490-7B]|uniref:extracellular solute-binding protein n=1 Tax=Austwickia sp. TVS 96-490-7B TaxID=2830843 RepID=UPI001C591238|nr:extracellular solute-binding protein [Austwickia sp. TVS 96-490-7B]MBW3084843.1 hypothetical protein [Austwickia sp. TVS 96-490-7B]